VKGASKYSKACNPVNHIPSKIVIRRAFQASLAFASRSLWWAHVRDAPEERRIAVFKRGTPQGCIGVTPVGGHVIPSSAVGERAL